MTVQCPSKWSLCKKSGKIVRFGRFYRTSDRRWIQRYKCTHCGKYFSQATFSSCFNQKKRQLNHEIFEQLASLVSQRRIAMRLNIHMVTVARKLTFLASRARYKNHLSRINYPTIHELQFDDMETFEHTKMKPLSVTLAVEKGTRRIIGFEVSKMPAKGLLAKKSFKKYGPRPDHRTEARDRLFRRIKNGISKTALIMSDQNPHYPPTVREHFPHAQYKTVKGQRGAITGQGELKKTEFDPLFSLNHTCAMFRANANRLIRKTWCTTKKIQCLIDHLEIYTYYHNTKLIRSTARVCSPT